ncbi:hypothetical protein EJ08DRAFT_328446 [Tothia fuscella]|uniref:Uncharacterized protein n=1 Tax=Tothia fuscella TaxID=1048955 RepID=A0A9P4TX24_9PEZI|nr:hypothetical protein EJ08DRAFT_328446 [Tothia fuscella]
MSEATEKKGFGGFLAKFLPNSNHQQPLHIPHHQRTDANRTAKPIGQYTHHCPAPGCGKHGRIAKCLADGHIGRCVVAGCDAIFSRVGDGCIKEGHSEIPENRKQMMHGELWYEKHLAKQRQALEEQKALEQQLRELKAEYNQWCDEVHWRRDDTSFDQFRERRLLEESQAAAAAKQAATIKSKVEPSKRQLKQQGKQNSRLQHAQLVKSKKNLTTQEAKDQKTLERKMREMGTL